MSKRKTPGTIYLNKNRYWWRIKLPGDDNPKARPLRPVGAKFATKDYNVAVEVARDMWQKAFFEAGQKPHEIRTIADLVKAYLVHAKNYYRGPDGKTTQEPKNICYAVTVLVDYCPMLLAEEFGPLKLKEVCQQMIERGWCRNVVNKRLGMIKRLFKWAASEQHVPASVYHGIQTVEGLRWGRSGARETEPVRPVAERHVRAVLPFTTPTVAAMIQLQLLTGMRSTEVCLMRPCDLETSDKIWYYRPTEYKTQYRGHSRIVAIGPRAQRVVRPFLNNQVAEFMFTIDNPRRKKLHSRRYDKDSYRKAVQSAIKAACKAGEKVPYFHPHQLRHTAATQIRKELGLDAARAVLGHRHLKITDDYAELDKSLADKAAMQCG